MNARMAHKTTGALLMIGLFVLLGCYHTPIDTAQGPAPLRMPPSGLEARSCNYEDSLTGGQVFTMYCGYCHFPRSLAERPLANYRTAAAHMRVVADLTGKEHDKLLEFLRRWHDVPPANPPVEPSPKRLIYGQPIPELRPQQPVRPPAPPEGPRPSPIDETNREQPSSDSVPQDVR